MVSFRHLVSTPSNSLIGGVFSGSGQPTLWTVSNTHAIPRRQDVQSTESEQEQIMLPAPVYKEWLHSYTAVSCRSLSPKRPAVDPQLEEQAAAMEREPGYTPRRVETKRRIAPLDEGFPVDLSGPIPRISRRSSTGLRRKERILHAPIVDPSVPAIAIPSLSFPIPQQEAGLPAVRKRARAPRRSRKAPVRQESGLENAVVEK